MSISIANRTFYQIFAVSGSFAIPSVTNGNLLVVIVSTQGQDRHEHWLSITTDVDILQQIPNYTKSPLSSNNIAGDLMMYPNTFAQADIWWCASQGGSASISWSLDPAVGGTHGLTFWVYELTGLAAWSVVDYGVLGAAQPNPSNSIIGPALAGGTASCYFTIPMFAEHADNGLGTVNAPWTLDITIGDYYNRPAYILNGSESQQCTFDGLGGSFPDVYIALGAVFGEAAQPTFETVLTTSPSALTFAGTVGGAALADQNVSVGVSPEQTVAATVGQPWLTVESITDDNPHVAVVRANSSGLAPGAYSGHASFSAGGASASVVVWLFVSPSSSGGTVVPGVELTAEQSALVASLQQIPLDASPNQTWQATVSVNGEPRTFGVTLSYNREVAAWEASIYDADGTLLISSLPLLTGTNRLRQFDALGVGSLYIINASGAAEPDSPNDRNLGTDFVLLWGNSE